MKTLELTEDACKLIAVALKSQIEMWQDHNKIGELKTLLDYINSSAI